MKSLIPMPKPIKIPAPKIATIHVAKVGNKFKVQHYMTHGPKPVPFVFSDPNKMLQHLRRIQTSQWRQPERNEAAKVTHDLNVGPIV